MSGGGSQQLRIFRRNYRDTGMLEFSAAAAGITVDEARDHVARDLREPPPPEAFDLIPDSPPPAKEKEADPMARGRKAREQEDKPDAESGEGAGINGEYNRPNAGLAFDIYDKQIKPKNAHLATIKGDLSQPYDDIKQQAHFPRKVLNFIVSIEDEEDAKRDHLLLALSEGLKHRQLFLPRDLVTMANGEDGVSAIPTGERNTDGMAALEDDEDDGIDGEDEFEEASDEELAAQEGRPQAGTGAGGRGGREGTAKRAARTARAATH